MKYKLNLDENNYLISFVYTNTKEDIYEMDPSRMKLCHLNCYKISDDKVIFDEEKYKRLVHKKLKEMEITTIKRELATYDYIGIKISMGVATKDEYAEKIAYTEILREKIRELESELE